MEEGHENPCPFSVVQNFRRGNQCVHLRNFINKIISKIRISI